MAHTLKTSRKGSSKKKAGNIRKIREKNRPLKAKNTHYVSDLRNFAAILLIK